MRIKGRYVATVVIDFDYEYEKNMLPFEEIKKKTTGEELTQSIKDVVVGEIVDKYGEVSVIKQYADLYEAKEGEK